MQVAHARLLLSGTNGPIKSTHRRTGGRIQGTTNLPSVHRPREASIRTRGWERWTGEGYGTIPAKGKGKGKGKTTRKDNTQSNAMQCDATQSKATTTSLTGLSPPHQEGRQLTLSYLPRKKITTQQRRTLLCRNDSYTDGTSLLPLHRLPYVGRSDIKSKIAQEADDRRTRA